MTSVSFAPYVHLCFQHTSVPLSGSQAASAWSASHWLKGVVMGSVTGVSVSGGNSTWPCSN